MPEHDQTTEPTTSHARAAEAFLRAGQLVTDADLARFERASEERRAEARAALEKLTRDELVDRVVALEEGVGAPGRDFVQHFEPLRRYAGPEDAVVVAALVDLFRAAKQDGRPDAGRFLDAALKVGAPLADAILGDAPTE